MRKALFIAVMSVMGSCSVLFSADSGGEQKAPHRIGQELSVPHHLADDDEFKLPLGDLLKHGELLFKANWTEQEGGGRPQTKGNGKALSDPSQPLTGDRAFNRLSAPDANSCYGCHNQPYGIAGGSGDFVTNVRSGATLRFPYL